MNIPVEFKLQVKQVFDEWMRLNDENSEDSNHDLFVSKLQQLGYLKVFSHLPIPSQNIHLLQN